MTQCWLGSTLLLFFLFFLFGSFLTVEDQVHLVMEALKKKTPGPHWKIQNEVQTKQIQSRHGLEASGRKFKLIVKQRIQQPLRDSFDSLSAASQKKKKKSRSLYDTHYFLSLANVSNLVWVLYARSHCLDQ